MPGLAVILRVFIGSVLIIGGLVGLVVPLIPGVPMMIIGLSIALTWHPKGLALWRRLKAWALRGLARVFGRRKERDKLSPGP
jgi:uncharacterized protein YqgC (DUF456 family)